jgi:RHH-type proline utilization regulon transcriptional repressor/proline dehydrogenase/delta 1-pyrroline-5-carboxylate dehydrogenase
MRIMGFQYVMGRNINEALDRSEKKKNRIYLHSYDMLGEAALTAPDADRYLKSYCAGIEAIGRRKAKGDIFEAPSISVKLSALHPRYEYGQRQRVMTELAPKLLELACLARDNNVALTVDAEEADRLLLSADVFAAVIRDPALRGWDGFGLAIQSYLKMCPALIDALASLAAETGHRIPVRLVKGAYWDTEIKHAQVEGYGGYPVFTRKANTDVSFIACARSLLANRKAFYPQFATHNAHTIAVITELAGDRLDYEFQRLHGMGEELYEEVMTGQGYNHACRVYAPVGSHEDLLPYLVRRLLENGSNTSFVNRIVDESLPLEQVAEDPLDKVASTSPVPHPGIPLPVYLYGNERQNSRGVNLANEKSLSELAARMQPFSAKMWHAGPILERGMDTVFETEELPVSDPTDLSRSAGTVCKTTPQQVDGAIATARALADSWDRTPAEKRAQILERAADSLEANLPELMSLCAREAGKTAHDAISEVREAADFCRYYAMQARKHFAEPQTLPGPTGELNQISLNGRGVIACISPWNFPLAIFMGQVSAALLAGNTVLAKPAAQTPLIAYQACKILLESGIPNGVLQLIPGDGSAVGKQITQHPEIDGVIFTGSTGTARLINRTLASRDAPLATFVAETGGQNAMLVDSSALPEQVVQDVIGSAFLSAGQRCSALRVLFLQEDVADRIMQMLAGAMQELVVGDPRYLVTDVGPVIDGGAHDVLQAHTERMDKEGRLIARVPLPDGLNGHFFAPCAYQIDSLSRLTEEVFGPVLHVIRYRARDLDRVIDDVNNTGYGLTLGVHSRIDQTQRHIAERVRAGNCYVNRSMTGAVVGVQPFGGEGLSGTGPKAGGPHYLLRLAVERTLTINTAAVGGNASLLTIDD